MMKFILKKQNLIWKNEKKNFIGVSDPHLFFADTIPGKKNQCDRHHQDYNTGTGIYCLLRCYPYT